MDGRPVIGGRLPEIIRDPARIEAIARSWRDLVVETGATPFASPEWLLPWRRHYAARADAFLLAWLDGDRLLGLLPMVRRDRRLPPLRELAPWANDGTALRGLVDLVARPDDREALTRQAIAWLAGPEAVWDVCSVLRLPPGSATAPALARLARERGWRLASNTGVVRSDTFVLDLPDAGEPGTRLLGAKARHNLRTEARRFERQGGRYVALTDAAAVPEVVDAVRRLSAARWGRDERTFQGDPAAEPFLVDALRAFAVHGSFLAHVARDDTGIRAALATLVVGRRAVALLIGVSGDEDIRRHSLGKQLFAASIDAAVERGAATYDFLWVGGYKEAFWGARPQRMESLVVGRGLFGSLTALRAGARRAATGPTAAAGPASSATGSSSAAGPAASTPTADAVVEHPGGEP